MPPLPKWFTGVLQGFAPLFSARLWPQVQLLVVGALLSPRKRTVTAALQVLRLADDPRFDKFHRLLINGPDSFNGITKRVSVRVKLIKTKPKETQ